MTIRSFSFEDHRSGWRLEEVHFSESLNLLVGLSGAGKTRILTALTEVCRAASGRSSLSKGLEGCAWELSVRVHEDLYVWRVRTQRSRPSSVILVFSDEDEDEKKHSVEIVFEDEEVLLNEKVLVNRSLNSLEVEGVQVPGLKSTESAISIFKKNEKLKFLYEELNHFFLNQRKSEKADSQFGHVENKSREYESLQDLKSNSLDLIQKSFYFYKDHENEFSMVKCRYMEMFPSVEDIKVCSLVDLGLHILLDLPWQLAATWMVFAIKERGVKEWIPMMELSSGMRKALKHLFELSLTPDGTTLLIDEYENSLGVNCLGALTEHIVHASRNIQFIITSHHPYVIEKIPVQSWSVVTRQGSVVRVRPASEYPELMDRSSQDSFTKLINSEAFEEGIQ